MTQENYVPIENPSLKSAVLTAIGMYLAEEQSEAASPAATSSGTLWRRMALKPTHRQPNTWRTIGLGQAFVTRLRG